MGGMGLISPQDQDHLRRDFAEMTRRVHLLLFTQTIGCDTCLQARQILDELPPLSDQIVVDEVNLVLERERAASYGVDRAPAIVVAYEGKRRAASGEDDGTGPLVDSRIRFLGLPAGYEFVSLVHAIRLAGGRDPSLSDASRQRLTAVDRPVTMQVFTTPT
jgi:alkyl hydroperoxide reductase subunit AhpF